MTETDDTANAEPGAGERGGHSDEKARQILDGARAIFLRDGFDGASMNEIARAAGVSKGTLYVYFHSKDELFAALVRFDKRQQAEQMCAWTEGSADERTVLGHIGRNLLRMMVRPEHVAHLRTVMAVAPKFPAIGRAFYEAGPQHGTEKLSRFLDAQVATGRLVIADTRRAAIQFTQMCMGDVYRRLMFCIDDDIGEDELAATVDAAVEVFMRAYGPRNPPAAA